MWGRRPSTQVHFCFPLHKIQSTVCEEAWSFDFTFWQVGGSQADFGVGAAVFAARRICSM